MRTCNEMVVICRKRQNPQPAFARLLLIRIEFPRHFRSAELKRGNVNGVSPNQDAFAAARNAKATVPDFMAMSADRFDICAYTFAGFE